MVVDELFPPIVVAFEVLLPPAVVELPKVSVTVVFEVVVVVGVVVAAAR